MSDIIDARKIWEIDRKWPGKSAPIGGEVHPDLVRFKGYFYCGFKETGRSRLIRSADGENWETVKLLEWDGAFVGRPYLSIAPEGALMINAWIMPLSAEANEPKVRTEKTGSGDAMVAPVKRYYVTLQSLDGYGGYSGVVEHDGMLWVACSNNSFPSFDVFMAKVGIPAAE